MPDVNVSVTVNRPPAAVFAYVADFARWPEWRLSLSSAERVTPGPTGVGTRVAVTGQAMGRALDMEVEITAYQPNERIGIRIASAAPIVADGEFRFAPEGDATRFAFVGTVEPSGLLKIAGPLVARQAHEMWATDLAALKGVLEG